MNYILNLKVRRARLANSDRINDGLHRAFDAGLSQHEHKFIGFVARQIMGVDRL